jgi:sugar phosphate isomerase/epimerase
MKFGVFTVMLPDLAPDVAAAALQAAGYEGVEWRVTTTPESLRSEAPSFWRNNLCTFAATLADAARARQLAGAYGLTQLNAATYLSPDHSTLADAEVALQFVAEAGIPSMRVNTAAYQGSFQEAFERSLSFFRELIPLASAQHTRLLIETHHRLITPSASAAHRFVSHFDPAHVGVIYDPGNMVWEGYEDYAMGLEMLGPYLAHVHLKNAAYSETDAGDWQPHWVAIDRGVADIKAILKALHEQNYDGWLVFEDFSGTYPSHEALRYNLDYVRLLLKEIHSEQA